VILATAMKVTAKMTKPLLRPYGLAILCVGLATLFTQLIHPLVQQKSFVLFFAAVIVTATYGGMGAALLATLLSVFLLNYFFDLTPFRLDFDLPDIERATVFTLVSVIVSQLAVTRRQMIAKLSSTNAELQETLAEVKTLRGILPICASCKKIRNSSGEWTDVAAYISDHTDAEFSHGMCEQCVERLYPEIYQRMALKKTERKLQND
jgi:K+-sensing histidine kinase KdpD